MDNISSRNRQIQSAILPSIDQNSFENIRNLNKKSKSSNLPSLDIFRNKSNKKQKIQKFLVARSDIDPITSSNIKFCSIRSENSDISLFSYFSEQYINTLENIIKLSKEFDSNRPNEFLSLFEEKCNLCSLVVDCYHLTPNLNYNISEVDEAERNENDMIKKLYKDIANKKVLLNHLSSSFQLPLLARKITPKEIQIAVNLFSKNIYRSFPPITYFPPSILFDRIEPFRDDAWEQISGVYTFFISLITTPHIETKNFLHSISPSFVKKLFSCFASPDDRERKQVVEVLYAIACRLPERCMLIFQFIQNSLIDSINDKINYWGLPQVLELLSKIMSSVPQFLMRLKNQYLKLTNSLEEIANQKLQMPNKSLNYSSNNNSSSDASQKSLIFLEQIFLFLHQLANFPSFSSSLYACIEIYLKNLNIEKSTIFLDRYINYFLCHYPFASQKKQVVFLNEIQQIVSLFLEFILPNTAVKLLNFIGRNLFNSPCVDISDKSLSLIFEKGFSVLINQYYSQVLPVLYHNARKASKTHHDDYIRGLAMAAIQDLSRINHSLFIIIVKEIHHNQKKISEYENSNISPNTTLNKTSSRQNSWDIIKEAAMINTIAIEDGSEKGFTNMICEYNNENGNDNTNKLNKEDLNYKRISRKNKNPRSNGFHPSQNSPKKLSVPPSLDQNMKQKEIRSLHKANFNQNIDFRKKQLFRNQDESENDKKIIEQPLPTAILKSTKFASPRIKNKEIVKINYNLKKQRR